MKKYKLLLPALFALTVLSAQNGELPPLIINEVGLMPNTYTKYIELVVAGNTINPTASVDLEGWILDNNSDAFASDSVYVSLGAPFGNLPPGAIILLYDQANPHSNVNPQNDGLPNSSGVYQLSFNSSALNRCVKGVNYDCNGVGFSTTNWNTALPLSPSGDVVQLRDPSKVLRQAVSWTADYVGNADVGTTNLQTDSPVITLDGKCGEYGFQYKGTSFATPGIANSDRNDFFVQSLLPNTPAFPQSVQINGQGNIATNLGDGEIEVLLSNGASPYVVSWTGPSNNSITLPNTDAYILEGLAPGTYLLSVVDGLGCESSVSVTVGSSGPSIPFVVNCSSGPSSGTDGTIEIVVTIGTSPYVVEWEGPSSGSMTFSGVGTYIIPNLATGLYSLTMEDGQGKRASCSSFVGELVPPINTCIGNCVTIGVPGAACFKWEPTVGLSDPNSSITDACPNESITYRLSVTENGNIVNVFYYEIEVSDFNVEILPNLASICQNSIELEVKQSFPSYLWSTGATSQSITVSETGEYEVTITNEEGCTKVQSKLVFQEGNSESVNNYLLEEGFIDLDIFVTIGGEILFNDPNDPSFLVLNDLIIDYANIYVGIDGIETDIEANLLEGVFALDEEGCNPYVYILKNSNICDGKLEEAYIYLEEHLPSLGIIIFISENNDGTGNLFAKVFGNCIEDITPNAIPHIEEDYSLTCVHDFTGFIDLLAQAEDALSLSGITDLYERIDIIRGIYYGTEWSVDFSVEASDGRNLAFNTYCKDADEPLDPRPIIGEQIYTELFNCAEVSDGNRSIDFGHLVIGLDARAANGSNVSYPGFGGTGPDIVTWLGDLGAGAGTIALRRTNNPNLRAITIYNGQSSFGSSTNLEGDIAAFVLGWNDSPPPLSIFPSFTSDQTLEVIFEEYVLDINSQWMDRARQFLIILGGEFNSSGVLINENELIENLTSQMETFGESYLVFRLLDNGIFDLDRMIEASTHLHGAANEVAQILITTLMNEAANPDNKIKATGTGPAPTVPGVPYTKYTSMRNIENWKNWIREQMGN